MTTSLVLLVAFLFRMIALGIKPPHFDEGINGHFVLQIWRDGFYSYDPTNFHGPLYFYLLHFAEILWGRSVMPNQVSVDPKIESLTQAFIEIISETNGIPLNDTLELMFNAEAIRKDNYLSRQIHEFRGLISAFHTDQIGIETLLSHSVSSALFEFFRRFPLTYRDEHTHLTGALSAEFIYPRLKKLLDGPNRAIYEKKIVEIYDPGALPIRSMADVDRLLKLKDDERFRRYLSILMLPKRLMVDHEAHVDAAYSMAKTLYTQ